MKNLKENIKGTEGNLISLDVHIPTKITGPLVVFAHGFNGFKDWGGTELIAQKFAEAGMPFLKFNFSHNGTTPDHLTKFADLEAYANNTIGKELNDLFIVLNWAQKELMPTFGKTTPVVLIGHSRGGADCILVTSRKRAKIDKLITWSAPAYANVPWRKWPTEMLFEWKRQGFIEIKNKRTQQNLPLNLELMEDFENHKANYDVLAAAEKIDIPWLICHGMADETVPNEDAKLLAKKNANATLYQVRDAGHTYGRKHPWKDKNLPDATLRLIKKCIAFLK